MFHSFLHLFYQQIFNYKIINLLNSLVEDYKIKSMLSNNGKKRSINKRYWDNLDKPDQIPLRQGCMHFL